MRALAPRRKWNKEPFDDDLFAILLQPSAGKTAGDLATDWANERGSGEVVATKERARAKMITVDRLAGLSKKRHAALAMRRFCSCCMEPCIIVPHYSVFSCPFSKRRCSLLCASYSRPGLVSSRVFSAPGALLHIDVSFFFSPQSLAILSTFFSDTAERVLATKHSGTTLC